MHKGFTIFKHAVETHGGRLDFTWKFVVVKTFQKALMHQLSEAVRINLKGEDNILNDKAVLNICAVPEITVTHNSKILAEEKDKFKQNNKEQADNTDNATEVLTNTTITRNKRKADQQPKWGEEWESEAEHLAKRAFLTTQTRSAAATQQGRQSNIDNMKGILKGSELAIRQIVLAILDDVRK